MRGCAYAHRHLFVAVCLALTAAACSSANYAGPVENFAGASRDAEEALQALSDEVTTGYANQVRALAASGAGLVLIDQENCLATSERCQLTVLKQDGSEVHYPPDPALANMIVVMAGIRAYADHLTDILKADTAAQVTDDVNATFGSIQSLATIVAEQSGARCCESSPTLRSRPARPPIGWSGSMLRTSN